MYAIRSPGANAIAARRWSMFTQSGVVAGQFAPVERGVGLRDDRPCVRVRRRFAGEVSGVEFLEGGVDVVGVEQDVGRDPVVGVDLDDARPPCGTPRAGRGQRSRSRTRTRRSPRVAMTVDVMFVVPTSAMARMFAISASRPCRTPAFTTRRRSSFVNVVGQYLGHGVPVAGREVRQEALGHSACRVFQPRCRTAELVESRERGVEVCLVEYLEAVDQVAFDRQKVDRPPLGVEALLRGPMRRVGDDRSEVAQPMHSLDVDAEVRREVPDGTDVSRSCHRVRKLSRAGGRCSPSPASLRASSRRLSAAYARAMTDHVCRYVAASPARYRASSSSKAASMSSRSNTTCADGPVVGVDLDDLEHLVMELLRPVADGERGGIEDEALPAGRDHGRRHVFGPDVGDSAHVCDFGIPTVSDPGIHDPPAIVSGKVVGQHPRHRVPVAGREVRHVAVDHSARRVFQLLRRTAELIEPRERGVDVCLVE